jgi:hypothetical protein
VAIDETAAEPASGALARLLGQAGPLGFPLAADTSGRLADGYRVQDLPWIEVAAPSGQIRYTHDGWLSAAALARAVSQAARPAG